MDLSNLRPPRGSRHRSRRIGRGEGSGRGGTSGKGHKGQRSRSGGTKGPGFEGGQMPLARRLPKRGFRNRFGRNYAEVNVGRLNDSFEDGSTVDVEALLDAGLISKVQDGVSVLGNGEISKALTVRASRFTKTAIEKIEKAGGKTEKA
ncbi:MAG: 50S ribosomal protein L15 [Deltaproteobacteria bacterium]|nr:50S ribosomal protein L15 [Deltaproteobacteria bacterium]